MLGTLLTMVIFIAQTNQQTNHHIILHITLLGLSI